MSQARRLDNQDNVDRTKIDTLRRYADTHGGSLRVEVQVGDETYQNV